jgi:hypothetical protein
MHHSPNFHGEKQDAVDGGKAVVIGEINKGGNGF